MLALIAYVIADLCFLFAALKVKVGDLILIDWGLFFLALGLTLELVFGGVVIRGIRRQAPPP